MDVSCHRPFLPGTSLEPAAISTAQASSFTLQYYYQYYCFKNIEIRSWTFLAVLEVLLRNYNGILE